MSNRSYRRGGNTTLVKIAFRNSFRNMRRTMFCVSSVGIAVFFIAFYSSMIQGMLNSMHEVVQVFELGNVRAVSAQYEAESEYSPVQYPVGEGKSIATIIEEIKAIPEVRAVFPRIMAYATLQESIMKHANLWGIRINQEIKINNFNLTNRTDGLLDGRYPAPDSNECAIGISFAQKTGLSIGDRIPLKTTSAQFSDKMWSPVITGIFQFDYAKMDKETIIVDFDRLQRLLVLDDQTQQIVVYAEKPEMSASIAREMERIFNPEDVISQWNEQYWIVLMDMCEPLFYAIYLVFLIVACFLIVNTITMIIHERIKEIGMMGSLGMTRSEIVRVFFFESVFLSMLGATLGVLIGGILTGTLQNYPIRWTAAAGESTFAEFPAASTIFLNFSWINLLQSWIMGVVVASLFTLFPSLKSAFVEPVEALRR